MLGKKIQTIVNVDGMSCMGCAKRVEQALLGISSVKKVTVNLDEKIVTIFSNQKLDQEEVKEKIENLGYQVIKFVEE